MYSYKGTYSTATPLTLLLIASTLGAAVTAAASTSTGSIRVYLAIAVSARINNTDIANIYIALFSHYSRPRYYASPY